MNWDGLPPEHIEVNKLSPQLKRSIPGAQFHPTRRTFSGKVSDLMSRRINRMTQNSSLRQVLVTWKKRSDDEEDPYLRFFILYMIFNGWLSAEAQLNGFTGTQDRAKLNWLKTSDSKLVSYWANFSLDPDLSNELLELKFVRNSRTGNYEEEFYLKKLKDLNNFNKIVEFVYQVRNNLFHGTKPYYLEGRNYQLVKSCSEILNIWIDFVLKNGG